MIFKVRLMSILNEDSCHAEVLVSAWNERDLKARLEDLTDCIEATRIDGSRWELRGLDVPKYGFDRQGINVEFKEDAVSYADVEELSFDDLEELLDGKKLENYQSVLKLCQFLSTEASGGC
jgi:hypothetical protein